MSDRDPTLLTRGAAKKIKRQIRRLEQSQTAFGNKSGDGNVGRHQNSYIGPSRIRFLNGCGATVPKFGVMRITGANANGYLTTAKVDATYRWLYAVNMDQNIADGYQGWCTFLTSESFRWENNFVLYDTGATPAYGERWGPKADSFLIWQHRPGFWIQGAADSTAGKVLAIQIPPGEVRVQNDSGGAIAAGGTGTVNLFGGAAGTTDLGLEIAVTNGSSVSWATTKYGWVTADAGGLNFVSPYQT